MSLNDLITRVEKHNIIPDLYNEGISYDELKKTVIDTLKPYFTNKANLKLTPIDIYLDSWIHFIKLQSKDEYFNIFKKILDFYNKSKSFEQNETFMIISSWSTDYDSGQSTLWSLLNSENILDTFENKEDYLNYVLQMLGSIIEGVTKPILKELYKLNKFLCSESISKDEINNLDLGVLVESLDNIAEFNNFFKPLPKRLKISQWRNIAYHHTAVYEDGIIKCTYGKGRNRRDFTTNINEIEETFMNTLFLYDALSLARTFFFLDNEHEITDELQRIGYFPNIRIEAFLLSFYTALSKEQFKILDCKLDDDNAYLILQDMTKGNEKTRAIHSSQILYNLWWYTNKKNLSIEYKNYEGESMLISSTTNEICEKIGNREKKLNYLAENVKFETLKDFI